MKIIEESDSVNHFSQQEETRSSFPFFEVKHTQIQHGTLLGHVFLNMWMWLGWLVFNRKLYW